MAAPVEVTTGKVAPTAVYRASRIALFGIPFAVADCLVGNGYTNVGVGFVATPAFGPWRPALIYGYSYQGHVYSLPEPVIMLVDRATATPANEAGYGQGYMRWEADKLDRTAQLMLTNDTFEELILRKNIGETRQPVAYHAMMMMSHRGGKLMD